MAEHPIDPSVTRLGATDTAHLKHARRGIGMTTRHPIPTDPVMYAERCKRLEIIANRIRPNLKKPLPPCRVVPTQPGKPPDFIDIVVAQAD